MNEVFSVNGIDHCASCGYLYHNYDCPKLEQSKDEMIMSEQPVTASVFRSIDGVTVVQIDTQEGAGRVRVYVNDGPAIYDADPETGETWTLF